MEVLTQIFGGGSTSKLYRALVIDQKIAVSAGSYYDADNIGPSRFTVYASPRPGVSMADLERAVEIEIDKLVKDGVTASAVSRAIITMQAEAIYARDSLRAGARVLGAALASGQSIDDVEEWPDRIGKVTAAQIGKAAKAVFKINSSVTALLLPAKKEGDKR